MIKVALKNGKVIVFKQTNTVWNWNSANRILKIRSYVVDIITKNVGYFWWKGQKMIEKKQYSDIAWLNLDEVLSVGFDMDDTNCATTVDIAK